MSNRIRMGNFEAECIQDDKGVRWVSENDVLESSLNNLIGYWYPQGIRSFEPDPARHLTQMAVNNLNAELLELDPTAHGDRDLIY
jgi:hypothetical protein